MSAVPRALSGELQALLSRAFGHTEYRPHQREVCESVATGASALLVMPTGAGKSICYQLPGLYRRGPTLVVSPLVALMDDQVTALRERSLTASAIHSGKTREQSREICLRYLSGELDFLYIAPERLRVPGFADFLARRTPGLIAIDEAHCISQWGHDFRPDYRLLRGRLAALGPAPIVALTATATPEVQQDIIEQLGMVNAQRFVHGFRRENLAIEACDMPQSLRHEFLCGLLSQAERRPAIVYAPTRKEAVALAERLRPLSVSAYHAGMDAHSRERVQAQFARGSLDLVVATVAFGMGIDKSNIRTVVHSALPGSVEGYYQEIGRAGRDQRPARALLLHSAADVRSHNWFHQRDYPELSILARVYERLNSDPTGVNALSAVCDMDAQEVTRCLEKLMTHGGCRKLRGDAYVAEHENWQHSYSLQRERRRTQLGAMRDYAAGDGCRMLALVEHFGDSEDAGTPCGLCDICRPLASLAAPEAPPNRLQTEHLHSIIGSLQDRDGQAMGTTHKAHKPACSRVEFQEFVVALARQELLTVENDEFTKEGRPIRFQRLFLTAKGHRAGPADIQRVRLWDRGPRARSQRGGLRAPFVAPDGLAGWRLHALQSWRDHTAGERELPAYQVLSQESLRAIAQIGPRNQEELALVKGVGSGFIDEYGGELLRVLHSHPSGKSAE